MKRAIIWDYDENCYRRWQGTDEDFADTFRGNNFMDGVADLSKVEESNSCLDLPDFWIFINASDIEPAFCTPVESFSIKQLAKNNLKDFFDVTVWRWSELPLYDSPTNTLYPNREIRATIRRYPHTALLKWEGSKEEWNQIRAKLQKFNAEFKELSSYIGYKTIRTLNNFLIIEKFVVPTEFAETDSYLYPLIRSAEGYPIYEWEKMRTLDISKWLE